MKSLYLLIFSIIPRTELTPAATETRKHTKLNIWSTHHFDDRVLICFCEMCIWIGKKTMSGQNPTAPRRARNSLKNGIAMAMIVAIITYIVLHINLNKLRLKPIFVGYSLFKKVDCGHAKLAPISTIRNNGWASTCNAMSISQIKHYNWVCNYSPQT